MQEKLKPPDNIELFRPKTQPLGIRVKTANQQASSTRLSTASTAGLFSALKPTQKTTSAQNEIKRSQLLQSIKEFYPSSPAINNLNTQNNEYPSSSDIFSSAFQLYLKGNINLSQLIKAKNFPNKFYKNTLNTSEINNERKNMVKTQLIKDDVGIEKRQKSQNYFRKISTKIVERVNFRKKVKQGLEKINPYYIISPNDPKFFQNYYSVSNYYVQKIKNNDLLNSNPNTKYYESSLKRKKVNLKEMELRKDIIKQDKRDVFSREKLNAKKGLYTNFFKLFADKFVKNNIVTNKTENQHSRRRNAAKESIRDYVTGMPDFENLVENYESPQNKLLSTTADLDNYEEDFMLNCLGCKDNLEAIININEEKNKKIIRNVKTSIKKKSFYKDDLNIIDLSGDSELQSLTEAHLDNLYSESRNIQKRILEKKNDGVGKRLKQFIKLKSISKSIYDVNQIKLKTRILN